MVVGVVDQELLPQLVREEKAAIVIISKQYRNLSEPNWVRVAPARRPSGYAEN